MKIMVTQTGGYAACTSPGACEYINHQTATSSPGDREESAR